MNPSILNPAFRYTSSVETDLKKTFAKERKRIADEKKREAETATKVSNIVLARR